MKQIAFCEYCMREEEYTVNEITKISTLNEEEILYHGKEAACNRCGNEIFVNDISRYNLQNLYDEYRERHDLINIDNIKDILTKYCIEEEPLSLLLGFEKNALKRYLSGDMISQNDSDVLKKVKDDIHYYNLVLQANKDIITANEYNKSRKAVKLLVNI